jgi:KUP system potassium uptake protein
MLGALGVVYGDIGTSPLHALKGCFSPENPHHVAVTSANVLGVLSLVSWALTMVIVVKYLTFIMRADNEGAGGILALLALVPTSLRGGRSVVLFQCCSSIPTQPRTRSIRSSPSGRSTRSW